MSTSRSQRRSIGVSLHLRRLATVGLVLGVAASCAKEGGNSGGSGGSSGSGGASSGSGGSASGGSNGTGSGGSASGGKVGSGGSASGGSGSGGTASGGSGSGGSASGGSGTGGSASGGSGSGGSASGGSASGGSAGGGSASGGSAGGAGGSAGGTGPGGGTGQGGGAGGAASAVCPANAFFCTDFETTGMPMGAMYISSNDNNDWTKGTALDTTVHQLGKQSLKILKIASYAQRQVQVPAAETFWFRVYLQSDVEIGGPSGKDHNAFLAPIWAGEDKGIEIVEEDCELGVNINDTRYGSNGKTNQPGCPTADPKGTTLTAGAMHCIEGFFDGTKGDFRVFADSQEVITLTGIAGAKHAFNGLRFGYRHYHERQRLVWYDDVVTAPQRIPCF